MGFAQLPNERFGEVFDLVEVTPGVLPNASDFNQQPIGSFTSSVDEVEDVIEEQGQEGPTDVDYHSASFSGTITLPWRFLDLDPFMQRALRDTTLPADVSGSFTVTFTTAGTHLDGTTGQTLTVVGANGAFDALNAASSQVDLAGAWLRITDAATAGNNVDIIGPKLVKPGSPRDVGPDTVIDLDTRTFNGAAAGIFGPWAAEDVADVITIDVGAFGLSRNSEPGGQSTFSMIVRMADITDPFFTAFSGVLFGGPSWTFNGRGQIMLELPWVAASYEKLSIVAPTSGAFNDNNTYPLPIRGGDEISNIAFAGSSTVIVLDTEEIQELTLGAPSTPVIVKETHGSDNAAGFTLPPYAAELGFNYLFKDEGALAKAIALQTVGQRATRERGIFYVEFTDTSGNIQALSVAKVTPATSLNGQLGGTDAPISGAWSARGGKQTRATPFFTYHRYGV